MQTSQPDRRLIISCLVILFVMCICLSLASIMGAGIIYFTQTSTTSTGSEPPISENEALPASVDQQLTEIESQIVELRGWKPQSDVVENFLSPEELHQHVLDDFLEDYTPQEAQEDALVLWSFGLLDKDFDLYNFYLDLYSEQIAGFYDQEIKEMFIVQDNDFAGPERLTYAHEYVHALQDQQYDIENGLRFNDDACESDSERCAAVQSLLEGDASLTEAHWLSNFATLKDQKDLAEFYNELRSPVFDKAPAFMQENFLFPYQQGQKFVETLYDLGGWEYVNQAYENPPVSTEQILHPESYPDNSPVTVTLPDLTSVLDQGWVEIDRGVMGEWFTYLILASGRDQNGRISKSQATTAVEGWSGDSYVVCHNQSEDSIVMVFSSLWDDQDEAQEYVDAFEEFATNRFGDPITSGSEFSTWQDTDGIHALLFENNTTTWLFAPDQQVMESLVALFKQK